MKKSSVAVLAAAVWILGVTLALSAQVVSKKQELAVFRLSYEGAGLPRSVMQGIDERIRGVFVELGRFTVIGMSQRLEAADVDAFIEAIRRYKAERMELPEQVQMGREFFTREDFERLTGSFIVVVPTVSSFVLARREGGELSASLRTAFTFIDVEEGRVFGQAAVETQGQDRNRDLAIQEALDAIPLQLTYEVRRIPQFQLKTGVLEVRGGEVILELGRDMGVVVGDEYLLLATRVLDSGKQYTAAHGLIVIKEVSEEVSVGKVIYAHPRPQVGDQLRELARLGMDSTPYLHVARAVFQHRRNTDFTALVGLRQSLSRGFYGFRPFVGLEVPFVVNILAALPVNIYAGGEYDLYLGRLQLAPSAALGMGGAYLWYLDYANVPVDKRFLLTYFGGMAGASASYLFHDNFRLSVEAGYLHWFSLVPQAAFFGDVVFPGYDGLYLGAGLTIKY